MLAGRRIGFIGAGSIAQALLEGLVGGGLIPADAVSVTNRDNDDRLEGVGGRWGVHVTRDLPGLVGRADIVILACKPADVPSVLPRLRGLIGGQTVISVAAGITTAAIEEALRVRVPVIRAMPNTSSQVRESATAICRGRWADDESMRVAEAIFASVGKVVIVPEPALDAVTALSGSGPAYVYLFTEAITRAGVALGLSPEVARDLAVQTVVGAACMLAETGADPAELRRRVTSPNGTTAAALAVLEERGFSEALLAAITRAAARSRELAELLAPADKAPGDKAALAGPAEQAG